MAYIGIDIGHGKNSPARGGSRGWTGDEHSFSSKVAVRTKSLLESMGHKVTFGVQNPNSNEVGLAPRTNYFNAQKVDVLVSIHANAHSNTSVNGVSAFYDRYGRGRDSASLKLAKAIMDEYRAQKQVIWSTGEVPSYRGNWTDFHMNRESTMPSVLMELGFMTGNRDREYVFGSKQPQFVEDMAQGIAIGVDRYFGGGGTAKSTQPQVVKPTSGEHYTVKRGDTLWLVATAHGLTLNQIRELNPDRKNDMLYTGDKLRVKGYLPPIVNEGDDEQPTIKNPKEYPDKGTFEFNTSVNVRNSPRLDNKPVALYAKGERVNYDRILYGAAYTWLSYISHNGKRRYVACGDNGQLYGKFV